MGSTLMSEQQHYIRSGWKGQVVRMSHGVPIENSKTKTKYARTVRMVPNYAAVSLNDRFSFEGRAHLPLYYYIID